MGRAHEDLRSRRRRTTAAVAALAAGALALAGCSGTGNANGAGARGAAVAAAPQGPALIASDDPAQLALDASGLWFTEAAYVVVADPADPAAVARAASIAAAAGVPSLLAEADDATDAGSATPLDEELDRLGAEAVLTVGAVDGANFDDDVAVVQAPAAADELGRLLEIEVSEVEPDADAPVQQLAALEASQVLAADQDAPAATGTRGELPDTSAATRSDGSAVVTDASPQQVAAVGTARAAGAAVVVSTGLAGGTSEAVATLKDRTAIVGLGTGFGDDEDFTWQALTASTGVELPGGGQQVFGGKRYVALYGNPITPSLGLLGEQGAAETITRAEEIAAPYEALTEDRVLPALEIIVTIASSEAGPDGNYSTEFDVAAFKPMIDAAREAGQYVVLDFQPGRTDFVSQIQQYEELLMEPHVGVALDPEWRLGANEVHLTQIGSVHVDEVNRVSEYLAGFVTEHRLPQKALVLHQFQTRMITERSGLDTSHPQVAVLIHADGQGSQGDKQATWNALHAQVPEGVRWGWKNFIDEDMPMLTPEQTYQQVQPQPEFVSYQ